MSKIRTFLEDNALMLAGMLLMLASAGVDGKFLSMWMSPGLAWLGYVLNLVSDSSGYVLSNAYGRLQNSEDANKRKLSRFLLVGEVVNIFYSWLFSFLVLRERFIAFHVNPITNNLSTEIEVLAFISAGFVPLLLVFLGYAESLNKTQTPKPSAKPQPVEATDLDTKQDRVNAMLSMFERNPHESVTTIADSLNVSRQTIYKYLSELEELGAIHNNGQGVKVLT